MGPIIKEVFINMINELVYIFEIFDSTEFWKIIEYPDVRNNTYEVSTFGRIRNVNTGKILKDQSDKSGYRIIWLSMNQINTGKTFKVHRLVAHAFIYNPMNKPEVNHINGDKSDNHISNLEWVTSSENQIHAVRLGLQPIKHGQDSSNSKISNEMVHVICDRLLKYDGDIDRVLLDINDPHVSKDIIKSIKYKQHWNFISDRYFEKDAFKVFQSADVVERICLLLVEYSGNINKVLSKIKTEYPDKGITYRIIVSIRSKKSWSCISDKYFSKETFTEKRNMPLDNDVVHLICELLVKLDGNISNVVDELATMSINIKPWMVGSIKRGKNYKNISKQYFQYNNRTFCPIENKE